jgi:uncharacterized membrane protein
MNVGDLERLVSTVGGGALALFGLQRRTLGGLLVAAAGGGLLYRGLTGRCPCYGVLGISTAKPKPASTSVRAGHGVKVEKTLIVNKPVEEVYRFWLNFENFPNFIRHLDRVEKRPDRLSHWVTKGPLGIKAEWDVEIFNRDENRLIAWRSLDGCEVDTAGSVHFAPAPGGGTQIRVAMKYDPPAGKAADWIAKFFGEDLQTQLDEDLCNLKHVIERTEAPAIADERVRI